MNEEMMMSECSIKITSHVSLQRGDKRLKMSKSADVVQGPDSQQVQGICSDIRGALGQEIREPSITRERDDDTSSHSSFNAPTLSLSDEFDDDYDSQSRIVANEDESINPQDFPLLVYEIDGDFDKDILYGSHQNSFVLQEQYDRIVETFERSVASW